MIYQKQVSTSSWRDVILKNLRQMAERVNKYKYPQAIENTSWCKTGNMKWWQDVHRGHKWLQCKVELSQDEEKSCSSLTIHYTWKSKHQHLFIDLNDVVCIHCEKEDSPGTHSFCIYTTERQTASPPVSPIRLCTTEEETMEDWVSSLCLTLSGVHGTMGKPHAQSMWSLTNRNDVFVHEPSTESSTQTSTLLWRHFGGHLHKVESNCLGITWGIANNGTAYCYSGGYGGGFFKGVASSPYGINAMVDTHTVYVYENQRWTLGKGYTNKAKLVRHYMWSDETGRKELTRNSVRLASRHMTWISDWMVDYRTPGGVDKEGWQYATGKSFFKKFHPRPKLNSYLRRRRWCRKYRVATTGPWEEMGPLKLVDVSVQPDPFQTGLDQPVAVWAVGSGGEMLCREGVTLDSFRGVGWIHVPSDQVFTSVSVSMDLVVWAVSKDGGVWIRQGLSLKNIAGTGWLHISPPLHTHLTQVSAGASGVWMVDKAGSLWCRTGITPQNAVGTGWSKVRGDVRQVSAGLLDQVWTIMDQCDTSMGPVNGVLAKYTKSSPDDPTIGTWETGIGGGWKYICARGQMI